MTIYTNYDGENIYKNSGERNEATHMVVHQLDMEGRYRVRQHGVFPIKEEYFDVTEKETMFNDDYYQRVELSEAGWKFLENEIKFHGRGWITFDLVDKKFLEKQLLKKREVFEEVSNDIKQLEKLI